MPIIVRYLEKVHCMQRIAARDVDCLDCHVRAWTCNAPCHTLFTWFMLCIFNITVTRHCTRSTQEQLLTVQIYHAYALQFVVPLNSRLKTYDWCTCDIRGQGCTLLQHNSHVWDVEMDL